jgi:hypothetical protein
VSTQLLALRNALSKRGRYFAAVLFILAGAFVIRSSPARRQETSAAQPRTKLAEGEYVIYEQSNDGAVGPFGEQVYNFQESWTLWRTDKDRYQVEGVRKFESPKTKAHSDRFTVDLSRDFTITHVEEFAKLKWVQDSGPLSCDFLRSEIHCSSGATNPKDAIELRTPLSEPYGLLWPVSPFSLSGITREIERDPARPTEVDLITIDQPSETDPVEPTILSGPIRYVGQENIKAADRNWNALKFSLKAPLHPEYLIWTSQKGLLLAVAVEHQHKNWQQEGIRLQRFQSWGDF